MYRNRHREKKGTRRGSLGVVAGVAALAVVGAGGAAATVAAGSGGSPAAVRPGTYTLTVARSGLCMDLVGGATSSGALVQQWGCSPGQSNQQWTLVDRGSGRFTVESGASGMCLDVPGGSTADGVRLQQWGCTPGQTNQLWTLKAARDDTFQIVNADSGLCVTTSQASTSPGAAVVQESCTTNSNKRWSLTPVAVATPTGTTITVAADGTGDVTTVQAAIDRIPADNAKPVTVAIRKGVYRGVVKVPRDKPYVTLKGLGADPRDVVIVQNHSAATVKPDGTTYGTSGSATAFVDGHDFAASNLTIANDYDPTAEPSQAVALNLAADRAVLTGVRVLGHQDTLLVNDSARSYFRASYVEGTVDFVFGGGVAVFDRSEIHQLGGGYLTAASTPASRGYGFLFYRSDITGTGAPGTGSLGRPWRPDAQVLYRESALGSFLTTAQAWSDMGGSLWRNARFSEYRNTGPGAVTGDGRPQLTDARAADYTPATYLAGSDGWNPAAAATAATVCKPAAYGARGDGTTRDTAALQRAIDACAGKGTVELTTGRYLSGALTLPGDLVLQIDAGATLLASTDAADYPLVGSKRSPLLGASGVNNLTITGGGTIDGQGAPWWAVTNAEKAAGKPLSPRPGLITIDGATDVGIGGITLRNAPNVNVTLKKVTTAAIDRITVVAPADSPNTDGIDLWSSSGVTITRSTLDTGDDDLAVNSSPENGPSHHIEVTGCTILHGHGLSIGSYTAGGVHDVDIHHNTLKGTTAGVRIKTARDRGGEVRGITYRNLDMTDVTTPVQITAYYPKVPADGDPAQAITATTPNYHGITVAYLTATGADQAGQIIGLPERPVSGLTLESVAIAARTGLTVRNATVTATGATRIAPAGGPAYLLQSNATVK
ncbi:hypothetical protein KCMC57_up63350 [Kitasatospora sp. CMC57]|uniref:Ricin B lectin domain-containing protein n=1 Tax=Kitasatospora sp. CMC57 TaxID=3231513 RepID=A0AB33KDL6_9ACTN